MKSTNIELFPDDIKRLDRILELDKKLYGGNDDFTLGNYEFAIGVALVHLERFYIDILKMKEENL